MRYTQPPQHGRPALCAPCGLWQPLLPGWIWTLSRPGLTHTALISVSQGFPVHVGRCPGPRPGSTSSTPSCDTWACGPSSESAPWLHTGTCTGTQGGTDTGTHEGTCRHTWVHRAHARPYTGTHGYTWHTHVSTQAHMGTHRHVHWTQAHTGSCTGTQAHPCGHTYGHIPRYTWHLRVLAVFRVQLPGSTGTAT